jgi:hypothetical protein
MKEYVYKLKRKYRRNPELLARFGFLPYEDEEGKDRVMAKPLTLPFECGIVKNTKRLFEFFRKDAEEGDFDDYEFNEDGTVVVTDEMRKEWTECQLCVYVDGLGKGQLFINAPDSNQYFNTAVLDECAKEQVEELLKADIVHKTLVR